MPSFIIDLLVSVYVYVGNIIDKILEVLNNLSYHGVNDLDGIDTLFLSL